ncbi:MAG: hypothetical protein ACI92O_000313 [Colwellia sp.]
MSLHKLTVITIDKICGEKFEVHDGLGSSDIYPESLKSMWFDIESQKHIINEDSYQGKQDEITEFE